MFLGHRQKSAPQTQGRPQANKLSWAYPDLPHEPDVMRLNIITAV